MAIQVVDRGDKPVDDSLAYEQRLDRRSELRRDLEQEVGIAVIQRRQCDEIELLLRPWLRLGHREPRLAFG